MLKFLARDKMRFWSKERFVYEFLIKRINVDEDFAYTLYIVVLDRVSV